MKILEIIPQLTSGGGERFTVDICNKLAETEDVTLVVFHSLNRYGFYLNDVSSKVRVISLEKKLGFDMKILWRLFSVIRTISPDIVHTHLGAFNYCCCMTLFNRHIKYCHTIHSAADKEAGNVIGSWLRKFFFHYHFVIPITISPESKNSFIKYYKTDAPMIYNGRNIPPNIPVSDNVKNEVRKYCKTENTKVLVHLARFSPVKRQAMLAKLVSQLTAEGHDLALLMIGNSDNEEILRKIESYSCPNVHVLGEKHNPIEYLKMADAYCLCSSHEGMPISFIEAIGVGAVPICTPVGGLVDVIKDGENGFLAKDISEASYYDALKRFMELSSIQIKELKKQVNLSYEPFSMDLCASKYLTLFHSL